MILFAKAAEVKEAAVKRRLEPAELKPSQGTSELLPEARPEPVFSVAERTTELLFAEKKAASKRVD